jgi:hypothetical protein
VAGDEVLVGKRRNGWACVWYQGRKHEWVSWIPARHVAARAAPPIDGLRGWVGNWTGPPGTITITLPARARALRIRSRLRWEGGMGPDGEYIVHYGGSSGTLTVDGPKAAGEQDGCRLVLTLIGRYLVADDNGACGGLNVRHTGVYSRPPRAKRQAARPGSPAVKLTG